jgi:hypothetical protein
MWGLLAAALALGAEPLPEETWVLVREGTEVRGEPGGPSVGRLVYDRSMRWVGERDGFVAVRTGPEPEQACLPTIEAAGMEVTMWVPREALMQTVSDKMLVYGRLGGALRVLPGMPFTGLHRDVMTFATRFVTVKVRGEPAMLTERFSLPEPMSRDRTRWRYVSPERRGFHVQGYVYSDVDPLGTDREQFIVQGPCFSMIGPARSEPRDGGQVRAAPLTQGWQSRAGRTLRWPDGTVAGTVADRALHPAVRTDDDCVAIAPDLAVCGKLAWETVEAPAAPRR